MFATGHRVELSRVPCLAPLLAGLETSDGRESEAPLALDLAWPGRRNAAAGEERRVSTAGERDPGATTFGAFLEAVGARTAAPAGGAASGLCAAVGAALLAMVARYTTGERYAAVEAEMLGHVAELARLERRALEVVRDDEAAFGAVAAAYAMARGTDEERAARSAAIQEGVAGATGPPLALAEICARLEPIARDLAERGHRSIVSDVATGAACVAAAADGALVNLAANGSVLRDEVERERLGAAVASLVRHRDALRRLVDEVRAGYETRWGPSGGRSV